MNVEDLPARRHRAPLSTDDELALWTNFDLEKSQRIREQLFFIYRSFARKIAARHFLDRKRGDIEFPDLCQLAYTGLLEAIDRYDFRAKTPFTAYAGKRIAGSVLDGVSKMSEVREQLSFRSRVRRQRVESLIEPTAGASSATDAMQALVDLAVGLALGLMLEGTGLYRVANEPDASADAYESLAWKETVARLSGELDSLNEQEKIVVKSHYVEGLDFAQIGALLGLSQGRVSQLHRSALTSLKRRLSKIPCFNLVR